MPGIVYLKHAGGNTRPGCLESGPWGRSRHETVHHHIMADTSAHDKQMENLMGAEVLVAGIKERKLQGVDDASHRVYDTAGQQPQEAGFWHGIQYFGDGQDAYPAHGNINQGREPFRAGNPQGIDKDTHNGNTPDRIRRDQPVLSPRTIMHTGV